METGKHFREAMRLFDALDSDFPNAGYWRFFADTHRRLGGILKAHKPQEAEETFRRLVELHEQCAAKHPANPEFNSDMSLAYLNLGDQLVANGRAEEAERFYRLAEAHWRQLVAGAPDNVEALRGLASTYHNLGRLLPRERGAEEAYAHAVETWAKLLALSPADVRGARPKGTDTGCWPLSPVLPPLGVRRRRSTVGRR